MISAQAMPVELTPSRELEEGEEVFQFGAISLKPILGVVEIDYTLNSDLKFLSAIAEVDYNSLQLKSYNNYLYYSVIIKRKVR